MAKSNHAQPQGNLSKSNKTRRSSFWFHLKPTLKGNHTRRFVGLIPFLIPCLSHQQGNAETQAQISPLSKTSLLASGSASQTPIAPQKAPPALGLDPSNCPVGVNLNNWRTSTTNLTNKFALQPTNHVQLTMYNNVKGPSETGFWEFGP